MLTELSEREREVADLKARGYSSKMIADRLFLSTRTVEKYVNRIFAKWKCNNVADLVRIYILSLDDPRAYFAEIKKGVAVALLLAVQAIAMIQAPHDQQRVVRTRNARNARISKIKQYV